MKLKFQTALFFQALLFSCISHASSGWPMVIGHRGMGAHSSVKPENTLPALEEALQRGVTAVEFDVQLTADYGVILAHDPKLERTTSGRGCVSESFLNDILQMSVRDGSGKLYPEIQPSTLQQALASIQYYDRGDRPFLADIHIKVYDGLKGDWGGPLNGRCNPTQYAALTHAVLGHVREAGMLERVIFTSFDTRVLDLIKQTEPSAKVGMLGYFRPGRAQTISKGKYDYVILNHARMHRHTVQSAQSLGLRVLAWTPNEESEISDLIFNQKVDGVITDNIAHAVSAREKMATFSSEPD